MGAEAVRHRLESQGTGASSTSAFGMASSAVRAFVSMVDPPPHDSIFGLDVIRGTFLARYRGARQFWVDRGSGGGGRLDVVMIPSPSSTSSSQVAPPPPPPESFLPLSPRKGREEDERMFGPGKAAAGGDGTDGGAAGAKKRKAVLYCNPNAGLVEVATGMGLTGGNVHDGDDGDEDDEREP